MWGGYQSAGGNKHIGGDLTGGIVGVGENCTIIGCANYASVGGGCSVGGIAGNISGAVLNCANYGLVDVAKDAALLAQYLAGSQTLTMGQLAAADVYHDGKANAKDAALLAQFLAGQGVSLD